MFIRSLLVSACVAFAIPALACTGISLKTVDNNFIQARTIEWGKNNLNSKVVISPRKHSYTSTMPDMQQGISWEGKYGFIGISVSDDKIIGEGMNEKGLNAGVFFFDGYGSLSPYDNSQESRKTRLTDMDFVRWALSQFASVDEVIAAFSKITLTPIMIENGKPSPTGHWRVSDSTGKNIVIEVTEEGKSVKIFENKVGVITNSPTFDWHVTNLKNYINIKPGTVAPIKKGDTIFNSFGAGTNFLGLPGDITPPSRFVRASFFVNTTPDLKTNEVAVAEAFHILNNFDIPLGTIYDKEHHSYLPQMPSSTQWTAVSDLNKKHFYYKTMNNSRIKRLDLNKVNFDRADELAIPVDNGRFSFDDVVLSQ